MSLRHRLAAIWFADIVDFSRLTEEDEEAALASVRRLQRAARDVVSRHEGRVVKLLGDGVLAEFDSSESAVRAACRVLVELEDGPQIRVGVHVGDVATTEDGDVYGSGVNVAARICEAAPVGGVAVSEDVQRQLRQRSAFRFEALGSRELKGVGPIDMFGVTLDRDAEIRDAEIDDTEWDGATAGAKAGEPWYRRRPRLTAAALIAAFVFGAIGLVTTVRDGGQALSPGVAIADSAAPGVAVLPFHVTGAGLEAWREGMVDLLSTNLDGVEGVRAIESRTVMARWDEAVESGREPEARTALEVARRSGARFAVLGRVVGIGDGVRLTASLYEVATGERLGRSQVDGSIEGVWGLVDRLTVDLLGHLEETGEGRSPVDLAGVTTDSLDALKAYLEGESRFRRSDFAGALAAFQRAVEIDSTFALAHYRLGRVMGWGGIGEELEATRRAARHLDRLTPRDRLVVQGTLQWNMGSLEAIETLERATRLYPDGPDAWLQLGEAYFHLGPQALLDASRSEKAFERTIDIDARLSPAYMHPIEIAFGLHADPERTRRLIDAYAGNAPAATEAGLYRLTWSAAFGEAQERRSAMRAIDTLEARSVRFVVRNHLWHPSLLSLHEEILTRAPQAERDPLGLAYVRLRRGRVKAARADLFRASVSADQRAALLYQARAWGAPVEASVVGSAISAVADRDSIMPFFVGAHAADEGRWDEHRWAIVTLTDRARRHEEAGDPRAADFATETARALRVYGAWRRGEEVDAADTLAVVQRVATGNRDLREEVNATIRLWLADLAHEAGDVDREIEYLKSFWGKRAAFDVYADYRLVRLLERAGSREAARRAYDRVATAWSEADPDLRARLEAVAGTGTGGSR